MVMCAPKGRVATGTALGVTSRCTVYRKYSSDPCTTPSDASVARSEAMSRNADGSGASSCAGGAQASEG